MSDLYVDYVDYGRRAAPGASVPRGVLNPTLYKLLTRRVGSVITCNEGQPASRPRPVIRGDGSPATRYSELGEYYRVNCFAPETPVATPSGDVPIKDLVGRATLLVPNKKGLGAWKEVEVRGFGRQPLLTLTLKRKRAVKTIRATPDHRWLVSGRNGIYSLRLTRQLQPGDRLASCFARKLAAFGDRCPSPSAVGVAQGFTFGDGSHPAEAKKSASTPCYGAKKEMLRYFASCRINDLEMDGQSVPHVLDLPRAWKDLPAADESLSFLYGWLSGYFAADGHVGRSGKQATLYSAREENLRFAKGICYQLGVRVSPIRPAVRRSAGCVPGAVGKKLFAVSFAVGDLPVEFWARAHHRKRAERWLAGAEARVVTHWTVASVVDRGEADEVYCAVVPGVEKFTLADNLLTMNCPFCGDRRHRLYVHHLWCTKDPYSGERMRHLATCYNEDCLHQHYADFEEKVFAWEANPRLRYPEMAVRQPEIADSGELREVELPGACPRLSELPRTHRAVRYLVGRGFDPGALSRHWDVRYCTEATTHREAEGRIIVPIRFGGKLVGWQGRFVGERDWKREQLSKYYNLPSFHKRRVLYNFDRASTRRCVVMVEGVADAWKVGRNALAVLGKTLSPDQVELLQQWKADHDGDVVVVLMLDADARLEKSYLKTVESLSQVVKSRRRVEVALPAGVDPGSLSRPVIWAEIDGRIEAAGLDPREYR